MHRRDTALFITLLAALPACLSPGPPLSVRSFEPARGERTATPPAETSPLHFVGAVGPVHLDLPMVWRVSPVELRRADGQRWIAPPADLVEERLRGALFFGGPFHPHHPADPSGAAPRLAVELVTFEGLEGKPPLAKVALAAELREADGSVRTRRFQALEEVSSEEPAALASAIGRALDQVVDAVVGWVRE